MNDSVATLFVIYWVISQTKTWPNFKLANKKKPCGASLRKFNAPKLNGFNGLMQYYLNWLRQMVTRWTI